MEKMPSAGSRCSVDVGKGRSENRVALADAAAAGLFKGSLVLVLLGLVSLSSVLRVVSAEDGYKDAYQQLVAYGFPTGLLPDSVTGYTLNDDGKFAVFLKDKCNVYIPGEFPVVYSKTITGVLSYGSLKDLNGIQVKAYYFWWGINAITVNNGNLVFEVGFLEAKYPVDNFDESPSCAKKSMVEMVLADE